MKALHPTHPLARADGLNLWFRTVAASPLRVLMLDFDGTLAPFTVDRLKSALYPGVHERLARLADAPDHRLIVVSGRTIADLRQLLGMKPHPECWGSHGWEWLAPDCDEPVLHSPGPAQLDALDRAYDLARREGWERLIEIKPTSVALHWRGMSPEDRTALEDAGEALWSPLAAEAGIDLHRFDGGLELRVPGRDKGTVVDAVLADVPENGAVAYLGDDLTDEDAFRALDGRGLRVLVRRELRPTLADLWIVPPEELIAFLDRWIDAVM
jgi:trehalose 6-phosphate phosphatase